MFSKIGTSLINTEVEQLKVRLYDPYALCSMLREVGFREIRLIKAFDCIKQADESDELIIYECRK